MFWSETFNTGIILPLFAKDWKPSIILQAKFYCFSSTSPDPLSMARAQLNVGDKEAELAIKFAEDNLRVTNDFINARVCCILMPTSKISLRTAVFYTFPISG